MKNVTRSDIALVAVLLAAGAMLRLWNLGGQSQWYDEMLATVHASFSARYILDLCWGVEIHPPVYYCILQFLQSIQASDAFLRLPSALAGIASLPLIGLLGARLGSGVGQDARFLGIATLGLACVNPMHIWISRQVRPYALMQLLCCVGFLLLFRILETPSRRNLLRLALVNAPIILLHHLGIVLMAGQCACLLVTRVFRLTTLRFKDFGLFASLSLLSMLPTLPFLISAKWLRASPFLQTTGEPQVMWDKLPFEALQFLNFGYFGGESLWMLPVAGLLLGLAILWKINPSRGLACLTLLAVFPLLLLVLGYTGHFTPVHLSYYLPLVFACQAATLRGLLFKPLRSNLVLAVLLSLLCALFLHNKGRDFYDSGAEVADAWHKQERYKTLASYLAALPPAGYFPVIDNSFTAQAVEWYLNRSTPPRSLSDFTVSPGQKQVDLLYFTKDKDATVQDMSSVFMRNDLPSSCFQGEVGKMDLYMRSIPRTGHIRWSPESPLGSTNGFSPYTLLSSIRSLENIRIYAKKHYYLCPATIKRPAKAIFRFASQKAFPAGTLYLLLSARISQPGNWLSLDASFDGDKEVPVFTRDTPSEETAFWLRLEAKKPFTTLDVRLQMYVSGEYAEHINGPLEQVRADNLLVFVPSDTNRFHSTGFAVAEQGLEAPLPDDNGGLFRWGHGASTLRFTLDRPQPLSLRYALDSALPQKTGTVLVNNQEVGRIALLDGLTVGSLDFAGKAGENVVALRWSDGTGENQLPFDAQTVRYRSLFLEPAQANALGGKD